jgi:hypothetical protein
MTTPCTRGVAARANLIESPAERGGATLVGLALAGFVLMAGVVAVDIGALAGARAAAQTAADMAALAALAPEVEYPPQSEPAHERPPDSELGRERPPERGSATDKGGGGGDGESSDILQTAHQMQDGQAPQQVQDGRASKAAEIALANGAELVRCDCSAVQAVVSVSRRVRFVPVGLTVLVTARARAVLGRPPP